MHRVTLDTNCLIAVERGDPQAHVRALYRAGRIDLRLVAASATDITVQRERVTNYGQFKRWLQRIDCRTRGSSNDALMMWSHLTYSGDLFVTTDVRDFVRNGRREAFEAMGAGMILDPAAAVRLLLPLAHKERGP